MTPPPLTEDEKTATKAFKQSIKDWLQANGFTQKQLSLRLGVTYGTVRNWLSPDGNISATNVKRIKLLMANPETMKHEIENDTYLTSIDIMPYQANMPLWRAAAMVKDVSFTRNTPAGGEAVQFAKWATPVVCNAIREELLKRNEEEIKELAAGVSFNQDPKSNEGRQNYGYGMSMTEDEKERYERGIPIQLPILAERINELFLGIAARSAGKDMSDFIADALNAAAATEFSETVKDFLAREEEGVDEVQVRKQEKKKVTPQEGDDIPF